MASESATGDAVKCGEVWGSVGCDVLALSAVAARSSAGGRSEEDSAPSSSLSASPPLDTLAGLFADDCPFLFFDLKR